MKHSIHLSAADESALATVLRSRPKTNLSRIAARAIRDEAAQVARRIAFRKLLKQQGVEISNEDRTWADSVLDNDGS